MSVPDDFDWVGYYLNNPQIGGKGCSYAHAIDHWTQIGSKQNFQYRQTRRFDWRAYINRYPDLLVHKIRTEEGALSHYIKHGKREGRNPFSEHHVINRIPPEPKVPESKIPEPTGSNANIHPEYYTLSSPFSFRILNGSNSDCKILILSSHTDHNVQIYVNRLTKKFGNYSFVIMRAEDHGHILSLDYLSQSYKSVTLSDYACIHRLIQDYNIKGIHIVDVLDFDLKKLSVIMKQVSIPYIITPFNWVDSTELLLQAKEIILPSQSSLEIYTSRYPQIEFTLIIPEKISYEECTSRNILRISIDTRCLKNDTVNQCIYDIQKRKLPLKIITDLDEADVIWIPIPLTQCYDYMISEIQCRGKLYVTAKTPLSSELSSNYSQSYLYDPNATIPEINNLFVLISNINTSSNHSSKRISMINSKYRDIYLRNF